MAKNNDSLKLAGALSRAFLKHHFGAAADPCGEVLSQRQEWKLKNIAWKLECAQQPISELSDRSAVDLAGAFVAEKGQWINQGGREACMDFVTRETNFDRDQFPAVRHALKHAKQPQLAEFMASGLRRG